MKKVISFIAVFMIAVMVTVMLFYIALPAFSLRSVGMWWFVSGVLGMASFAFLIKFFWNGDIHAGHIITWISTLVILFLIVLLGFIGSPVFQSNTYKNIVQVTEGNFSEDFEDISQFHSYNVMDLDTAQRLGDRVLGKVPNASWYEIDKEYNLIIYQGKQYRISPLKYGGFFKYEKAKKYGIPGYVLVDCESNEASFIQTEQPIRYSTSSFFNEDLKRLLRFQYPTIVFESHFMEINDEGVPYWVSAVSQPQVGVWSARKVDRFVLTNACMGQSKMYFLEDRPEWLNHIFSLEYMMKVSKWHYQYVHGWWNPSNTDVWRTTYSYADNSSSKEKDEPNFFGYNSFVNKKGEVLIFTGITPANKTESNVGFLTVNTATGKCIYYPIPGAEESSAQVVVEGLIQNMGYQATYPIMVNVAGHPTYLMNMKDKSGLIQRYAMVSLENYSNAYVGASFEDTVYGYLEAIGITEVVPENVSLTNMSGVITEKYQAEIDGTSYFYYVINDELYRSSVLVNEEQVRYQVGDYVQIEYASGNIKIIKKIERVPL